jgi:hypothetical protein
MEAPVKKLIAMASLVGAPALWAYAHRGPPADMADAGQAFLIGLSPELRARASLAFDDPNRLDWHFVPRQRTGVALGELDDAQRSAAMALLRSGLSEQGARKAEGVLQLEAVLREMESARGGDPSRRDPGLYHLIVFGSPSPERPWGWRFEGHHVSLNFCSITGEVATATPSFLGAQPATVSGGPNDGLRVLAAEEDLARELVASLDAEQRATAVRERDVPADVILGPARAAEPLEPQGIEASALDAEQRALLLRLLEAYVGNLEPSLAAREMERIRSAGIERLHFLWIGATAPGQPHYYRIQGPTFVIELDNVQDRANHVHTLWRDLENDFGGDLLRRHHEQEHRR